MRRLVLAVVLLVLALVAYAAYNLVEPAQAPFPEDLAGLRLTQLTEGDEALRAIDRLHGKAIEGMVRGWVATYVAGSERALIWVAEAGNPAQAQELLAAMVRSMHGGEVFSSPRPGEVDGLSYYTSTGLGMYHYFYARGDRVVWVAVGSPRRDAIFRAVLGAF